MSRVFRRIPDKEQPIRHSDPSRGSCPQSFGPPRRPHPPGAAQRGVRLSRRSLSISSTGSSCSSRAAPSFAPWRRRRAQPHSRPTTVRLRRCCRCTRRRPRPRGWGAPRHEAAGRRSSGPHKGPRRGLGQQQMRYLCIRRSSGRNVGHSICINTTRHSRGRFTRVVRVVAIEFPIGGRRGVGSAGGSGAEPSGG